MKAEEYPERNKRIIERVQKGDLISEIACDLRLTPPRVRQIAVRVLGHNWRKELGWQAQLIRWQKIHEAISLGAGRRNA